MLQEQRVWAVGQVGQRGFQGLEPRGASRVVGVPREVLPVLLEHAGSVLERYRGR